MKILTQKEFVDSCIAKYRWEVIPEGMEFEDAHYPDPKCKEGTETIPLWSCDHTLQGLFQSEELNHPCLDGRSFEKDTLNLEKYYPEYLPLLYKWDKIRRSIGGKAGSSVNLERNYELVCNSLAKGRETCKVKKLGVHSLTPEERKENGRKGGSKGGGSTKRSVLCLETKIVYLSACHASKSTGINRGHIGECCRGKRKTAGGNTWKFATGDRL
jgi:hypothetical protein